MGNLTIKNESLAIQATYEDEEKSLTVEISATCTADKTSVKSISGSIYKGEAKSYAGNFSGVLRNEEMEYSFSGVKLPEYDQEHGNG